MLAHGPNQRRYQRLCEGQSEFWVLLAMLAEFPIKTGLLLNLKWALFHPAWHRRAAPWGVTSLRPQSRLAWPRLGLGQRSDTTSASLNSAFLGVLQAVDLVSDQMTGNNCYFFPMSRCTVFFKNGLCVELSFKNAVIWLRLQLLSIYLSRISIFEEANNPIIVCNPNIRTYNEKCRSKIVERAEAVGSKLFSRATRILCEN